MRAGYLIKSYGAYSRISVARCEHNHTLAEQSVQAPDVVAQSECSYVDVSQAAVDVPPSLPATALLANALARALSNCPLFVRLSHLPDASIKHTNTEALTTPSIEYRIALRTYAPIVHQVDISNSHSRSIWFAMSDGFCEHELRNIDIYTDVE